MGIRSQYPLYPMIIEAEQTDRNIVGEYIRILNEISLKLKSGILKGDIVKHYINLPREKFKELEREFEEIRKKFVESSFIPKLSKFIKSTYPNEVDVVILSTIIYDIIEKSVEKHIIPCYIYDNGLNCKEYLDLEKYKKGLDLLLSIHYDLLNLWLQVYHNKRDLPNLEQSLADIYSLMYRTGQIVDTETLMRLARKEAALRCIENTVYDLFENPDKHQQLIKEGNYLDEILKRYCK
jgi:hypothetical protein